MKEKNDPPSSSLVKQLIARRVPQILSVYMVTAWTMLQFIDWIVNRYSLSPYLPDLALTFFLALIPSIIIVAYFHGRPGKNKWHRIEIFGVPLNIVAMVCLAFFLFSGKDLGSTQKKVKVSDESGKMVEKVIPKSQFRKKIVLFFFENRSGKREDDWLQYALTYMLQIDLSQDMYIETSSPNERNIQRNMEYFVFNKIKEAGFKTGVGLPLLLMKKIAGEIHRDYFACGGITRQGPDFRIDFALYRSKDMKMLAQGKVSNADIFAAVDQLSLHLKQGMDIPSGHLAATPDLPVGEIFTSSLSAARLYIDAANEMVLNQNWEKARESLEQAVKADPAFAYANLQLSGLYMLTNKTPQWVAVQKKLMQQLYKLPEKLQYMTKSAYYASLQEPDKALAILNMAISLFPDDVSTYYVRAQLTVAQNRMDAAIADYRKIQEIDPEDRDILLDIAELYERKGDFALAEKNYQEYANFFPNDSSVLVALGNLKLNQGEHDQARAFFQKALLIDPNNIGVMIESGKCEFELGKFADSLAIYEKAQSAAGSAEDKYKVYDALQEYAERRGQMKKALEYFEKKIAEYKKFTLPLLAVFVEMDRGAILMQNHRSAEAFQSLAALQKQMTPPFDKFVNIGYIETYLLQKKADEAEKCLPDIQTLITKTGTKVLQTYVLRTQGKIAEIRGNYGQAIAYYLELKKQSPGVLTTNHSLAVCYRFLKEYDKAEEALKKALLISPFSAVLNREAAQLYWDMGKKAEALNYLKKAAMIWQEADPDYEPALKVREQLQAWTS